MSKGRSLEADAIGWELCQLGADDNIGELICDRYDLFALFDVFDLLSIDHCCSQGCSSNLTCN